MDMSQRVWSFVNNRKWESKVSGSDEVNVKFCPYCMDSKFHFYINLKTGAFYCHKCNKGGSFYQLLSDSGDIADVFSFKDIAKDSDYQIDFDVDRSQNLLFHDEEACHYLIERGIGKDAILHFKLGIYYENGSKYISIPYIIDGKVVNVKLRNIKTKEYKRINGGKSVWFNEDIIPGAREVIITEGEFDAISLWSNNIRNVISIPDGALSTPIPESIKKMEHIESIYLCFDNDEVGKRGAFKLAERLGKERCFIINLEPYKDANEMVLRQTDSYQFFMEAKSRARLLAIEAVRSIGDILRDFLSGVKTIEPKDIIPYPWKNINNLTGGMAPGDLIVLVARPGIGKTTFAINMLYQYALQGIPSLLFELEMLPERILPRICSLHLGIKTDLLTNEEMLIAYEDMKDLPFYFAYSYKKADWRFVEETIRACVRILGIKFLVFDNIHFLVRSTEQTKEISILVNNLKLLAQELRIVIMAIARPRKTLSRVIDNVDIKDSADVEGDADQVVILHREHTFRNGEIDPSGFREGIFGPLMLVRISKCRWNRGGECLVYVHDETCKIVEKELELANKDQNKIQNQKLGFFTISSENTEIVDYE